MGVLKARFSVDRGGTFTDIFAELVEYDDTSAKVIDTTVLKLLSEDPKNYSDAPREGIRRILEKFFNPEKFPKEKPLDTSRIESIRMGTTVATNALLERKGERFALLTTKGLRSLWHIGTQSRPEIFDLSVDCPETLYEFVEEIDERIVLAHDDACKRYESTDVIKRIHKTLTGESVLVEKELDDSSVKATLQRVFDLGIRSIAVVFLHSPLYPEHELRVGSIAKEMGFVNVSLSHEVMRMVKILPRGYTASADAYLTPHIHRYIKAFCSGFDPELLNRVQVSFMQSDGGLTGVEHFSGHRAILSGPAGGVVGYALTSEAVVGSDEEKSENGLQVVGFDMGGTSTDVSRYAGRLDHVLETVTAGITIQAPQLDIHTVAAGGGSRLTFRNGVFMVGPESVGAHPGPVCYRKNGNLAVTDANLVLGRVIPDYFPHIFGKDENLPLDLEGSTSAFKKLQSEVNKLLDPEKHKSIEEIADGFLTVANEAMSRPIRNLTQMRGYDLTKHVLACFGGAGGQHACAIARSLGMKKVFIHRHASILSAYGIGLADVVEDCQEPCAIEMRIGNGGKIIENEDLIHESEKRVSDSFSRLSSRIFSTLSAQKFGEKDVRYDYFLNMRFKGTDTALMVQASSADQSIQSFLDTFYVDYKREFGFLSHSSSVVVDDVRVRGAGHSDARVSQEAESALNHSASEKNSKERKVEPVPLEVRKVFFHGEWVQTDIYRLDALARFAKEHGGNQVVSISGPAILIDSNSTVVVEGSCVAHISSVGNITLDIFPQEIPDSTSDKEDELTVVPCDPIVLSLFSHRFMGIAEQMGRTLQRTAISVNIKERLDFSCALFSPNGGLVANAPHIPVHLGAMQEAIRFQWKKYFGSSQPTKKISDGDVLVSNHPQLAGGSHLPDITVITPCFREGSDELLFWVASRGHHTDVGGIAPGSMPPNSTKLADEGAHIVSFVLVEKGEFQEDGISKILCTPTNPEEPLCSGTRMLSDNLSDLRAQVAANNHGIRLLKALVKEHSIAVVHSYMRYIQDNAELAVRTMLKDFCANRIQASENEDDMKAKENRIVKVFGKDVMDDGTPIQVAISINADDGSAVFDFEGTGPQVSGNCNAPPAVTFSAVIYSLRCLVGQNIPLNEGCLNPVKILIPSGCIINPDEDRAVVGGNVLTSQRVVDVVLRAYEACAASQGCMNNLTFGDSTFGYYETIAGGAGAGPTWDGRSGVHTHMTNTRITDPEILEHRYPAALRTFDLRKGSGGIGYHNGGDGVIREIEFFREVVVSLLTERREYAPYGMKGGSCAQKGENYFIPRDGQEPRQIAGKCTLTAKPGDRIRLMTPGGGGYGVSKSDA